MHVTRKYSCLSDFGVRVEFTYLVFTSLVFNTFHLTFTLLQINMVGFRAGDVPPTATVKFIGAGTAACIADLFTFPLDTAKVRLQVSLCLELDFV
ncbi:hypothetical protein cypCar_00028442 [Cyprinus carpio]|nr:hypothetical protein cypCar_00028442 [Cyprinus carpio]